MHADLYLKTITVTMQNKSKFNADWLLSKYSTH